jgi:DegT/DnrJ/EryC1/StrS aminotransferase family protein
MPRLNAVSARPGDVKELVAEAVSLSRSRPPRPVAFIERKAPDLQQLQEILRLSADTGYWTNFGPVCRLLETALRCHLNLPPERSPIMCSSGTAALLTLAALKEYRAGKKLRWVISAFGFRSTYLGPLADALVLDCDDSAMLDPEALVRLDPDSWDGLVLTNVFGLRSDVREYHELCRRLGKELIVDNAGLLDGFQRDEETAPVDEILSFHQTKPWGMGEGGCVIVAEEDACLLRELTNTGENLRPEARAGASNSKISDFSCALILQRLAHASAWSGAYREQARRILAIALDVGLRLLGPIDLSTLTLPHLPLLAPHPVAEPDLGNGSFVMQKYYRPLVDSVNHAWIIYSRIVNVPSHPGMAALTDVEIHQTLKAAVVDRYS